MAGNFHYINELTYEVVRHLPEGQRNELRYFDRELEEGVSAIVTNPYRSRDDGVRSIVAGVKAECTVAEMAWRDVNIAGRYGFEAVSPAIGLQIAKKAGDIAVELAGGLENPEAKFKKTAIGLTGLHLWLLGSREAFEDPEAESSLQQAAGSLATVVIAPFIAPRT